MLVTKATAITPEEARGFRSVAPTPGGLGLLHLGRTGRTWICETGEHRYHRNRRAAGHCWVKAGPTLTIPVIGGRRTVLDGG